MVCEKTPDSNHDFSTDPIKLIYQGEWLTADKTSLGADNGIAIALAMTLALDKELSHPPLDILFTVDEESGLIGASALEPSFFDGRILINIDSEDEGHFTVGCAGGLSTHIAVPIDWAEVPTHYQLMKINAGGMKGGHSGVDINAEKANAIKILAQTLHSLKKQVDIRLANFSGGTAHNAIPRDSEAFVFVPENKTETVKTIILETETQLKSEYTEPDLFIKIDGCEKTSNQAITSAHTNKVLDVLMGLPHGVATMDTEIKGVVETSNNLAHVSVEAGNLKVLTSQRSSRASRLDALTNRIEAVARLAGGETHNDTYYPAWLPNMESPLLAKSCQIYERLFDDKKPVVEVMHAGLECGIIGDKISGMDMISIGPTLKSPHSPDEKIHIGSIGRVWDFLRELLKDLK
jgi:dipeptidase D